MECVHHHLNPVREGHTHTHPQHIPASVTFSHHHHLPLLSETGKSVCDGGGGFLKTNLQKSLAGRTRRRTRRWIYISLFWAATSRGRHFQALADTFLKHFLGEEKLLHSLPCGISLSLTCWKKEKKLTHFASSTLSCLIFTCTLQGEAHASGRRRAGWAVLFLAMEMGG